MTNTAPTVELQGRYNATDAARLLGISRRTLYNWEENGRIKRTFNKNISYFTGTDIRRAWAGIY